MYARSTNVKGFVHYGGDLVAGVEDGIGVHLRSASTGSTAIIEALSDSDTAALKIRAKGAAGLTVGNSSNALTLAGNTLTVQTSSNIAISASNLTFKGAYSTTFAWTLAAISSGQQLEVTLTTAVGGSSPIAKGDLLGHISLNCTNTQMGVTVGDIRWSTVATSVVTILVGNITSTATSTLAGIGYITWLDLT